MAKITKAGPIDLSRAKEHTAVADFLMGPGKDFALYDNVRKIPSIVDGLKPSQRKAIYGALKRLGSIGATMTVERLAAAAAEVTAYHHGTGSMEGTIVGLAQAWRGSNNINLMIDDGQFGNILDPVSGAPRYIESGIHENFRTLFKKDDELILEHLEEDGVKIEPRYYLPILPMVLVNGSSGIGVGFASKIMNYNPADLRKYITNVLLKKKQNMHLTPWYRGFRGTITRDPDTGQVIFKGKIEKTDSTTLKITELPIGTYQDNMKTLFANLMEPNREGLSYIKDFEDRSSTDEIDITVIVPRTTGYASEDELYKKFKLISRETENFTVWLPDGRIRCFDSAEQLCEYFIEFRLAKYEERRLKLIEVNEEELSWLNEKLRFILYYIENSKLFAKKRKDDLIVLLTKEKFRYIDRLLDIRIYNLTLDEIEKLKKQITDVEVELKRLRKITATEIYLQELEELKV